MTWKPKQVRYGKRLIVQQTLYLDDAAIDFDTTDELLAMVRSFYPDMVNEVEQQIAANDPESYDDTFGDIDDPGTVKVEWLERDEDSCYVEMIDNSDIMIELSLGRYAAEALAKQLQAYLDAWHKSLDS